MDLLAARRREAGQPTPGLDIALHVGTVQYGNVGTEARLDFTVIGPAVNEAARIELLCKELGHPLLVSQAFAEAAERSRDHLVSVGRPSSAWRQQGERAVRSGGAALTVKKSRRTAAAATARCRGR